MADQVRALFHKADSHEETTSHKDKLAETKKRDKEIKDALKHERQVVKEGKHQEHLAEAQAYRFERSCNPTSKRAAKDARHAERHDRKMQDGEMCEHGVWKCRICFPVVKPK